MKFRILLLSFVILIIVALFFVSVFTQNNKFSIKQSASVTYVEIGNTIIPVEIADTEQSRIMGLSGRKTLPIDTGMLFVFDMIGRNEIWMKDMNFPIDIMWISDDFKIVRSMQNVSPETFPQAFGQDVLSLYILEVPSGFIVSRGINVLDTVKLIKN